MPLNVTMILYVETENAQEFSPAGLLKLVHNLQAVVASLGAEDAALKDRIAKLQAQLAAEKARVDALEITLAKARKNSSNSSKPPARDIVPAGP